MPALFQHAPLRTQALLLVVAGPADGRAGIAADPSEEHTVRALLADAAAPYVTEVLMGERTVCPGALYLVPAQVPEVGVVAGRTITPVPRAAPQEVRDGGAVSDESVDSPAVLHQVGVEGGRGRGGQVAGEVDGREHRAGRPETGNRTVINDRDRVVVGEVGAGGEARERWGGHR